MPYLAYQGQRIFYKAKGKGEHLLILHGNTVSSAMMGGEYKHYRRVYRTFMFDYPGHGKSDPVKQFPDDFWRETAKCAAAVCAALGVQKTYVLGTEGGAMVALNLAIEAPGLVKKVIADSFLGEKITVEDAKKTVSDRNGAIRGKFWYAWFLQHGFGYKKVMQMDNDMLLKFAESGRKYVPAGLEKIQCPVLFTGAKDNPVIENLDEKINAAKAKNPLFESKIFLTGGHMTAVSKKHEFRHMAEAWFNK